MKPHLPKKLLVAVLAACSMGLTAKAETAATSYTLGDVMYVGDSITHGVDSSSYRWALHKILVDNGVYYNEVGYHTGHYKGWGASNNYTYCGVTFENLHSANASQRTYETAGRKDKNSLMGASNIKNWLGFSDVTNTGATYTGSVSTPDTFMLMLGTNDLLSDYTDTLATGNNLETVTTALLGAADTAGRRTGGDMGTIVDTMYASNADATVYVTSIPCWANHSNNKGEETHVAVQTYNESLKKWVRDYNAVNGTDMVLVDVNRGLLDVAASKSFYGVSSMFNNADGGSDGLHPNSQGDLLIAGNMARAMGIAGRTAGLERVAATDFRTNIAADSLVLKGETTSLSFSWADDVTPSGGYTAELMGFTLGNGAANGWDTTNNFSITVGNGSMSGTLDINEAYIQWNGSVAFSTGSTVLFSENMSALTENIRIAYHTGDSANNVAEGYYIWLGDMLIGEALQGKASTVNGVALSYSGSSSYTLSALAMDATAAYAPTVGVYNISTDGKVVIPNNVTVTNMNTTTAYLYASNTAGVKGDVWVEVTGGQAKGWAAAQGNTGGVDGNVTMIFSDDFLGAYDGEKDSDEAGTVFGAVNSPDGVSGNVTVQFDAANAIYNSFSYINPSSVVGSYASNIGGTFKAVVNAGTFTYDVLGGIHTGDDKGIGATQIFVNGGTLKGSVYGGGVTGSILGDTRVVINGGAIAGSVYGGGKGDTINGDSYVTINGGEITGSVYAGGTAGTIKGDATLVIDGALTSIGENIGATAGGSIQGNALITIKNITASEEMHSAPTYSGNITGGTNVVGTSTLVLDNADFSGTATIEAFNSVNLVNGSNVSVANVNLDAPVTSVISLADNSQLTVSGSLSTTSALAVSGGAGTLVLSGAANTVEGQLSIAEGNTLVLQTGSSVNVKNAIVNDGTLSLNGTVNFQFDSTDGFVYSINPAELNRPKNGLGSALVEGEFITGAGTLTNTGVIDATINGNDAQVNLATGQATVANSIYYVVAPEEDNSSYSYLLTADKSIGLNSTVNVGIHDHIIDGPTPTAGANDAGAFYVGDQGVLCISGGSNMMNISELVTTTQGTGAIVLRAPGRTDPSAGDTKAQAVLVELDRATQFAGDLYLGPVIYDGSASLIFQSHVRIDLNKGADVSSFKSIHFGQGGHYIYVNGEIARASETVGHINNLTALGSSMNYLVLGADANERLVLGGDTVLQSHDYDGDGVATQRTGNTLYVDFVGSSVVEINHLTSGRDTEELASEKNVLWYTNGYTIMHDDAIRDISLNTTIDINSFDYRGAIYYTGYAKGSQHINLTLLGEKGQYLYDNQYRKVFGSAEASMTIKGSGTYILGVGRSILDNFGVLSTEKIGDKQVWSGTVEVNQLVAMDVLVKDSTDKFVKKTNKSGIDFADYGNDQSTIHFKGFKGHVFDTVDNDKYMNVTIGQDLILTNPDAAALVKDDNGNPVAPHAFEVANGYTNQKLHFTGDISGTGDFVVSAPANENIFFKGDVSEWKDGAEFKVTNNTQYVTFQDNATEINADLVTTGGTMNATISNTDAVTVNGKVSKAAGGALNLTVSTDAGTTFTNEVNVSSLSVSGGSKATFGKGATAGDVSVGLYKGAAAEVSDGMTIATTTENDVTTASISGGKAVNVDFVFDADKNNTVRNATLENVSISSVGGSSVLLENLNATNVQLYGEEVNFCALEVENSFYLVSASETHNEIRLESDAFAGMTLTEDGQSMITLTVNNDVNWNDVSNENLNNVTIVLKGFKMEGVGKGKGWLSNLIITGDEDATAASLLTLNAEKSTGTELNVNELLAVDKYDYVTYEQKADGLHIRMSNIPEPSTATLSLLALAALASRRRRK